MAIDKGQFTKMSEAKKKSAGASKGVDVRASVRSTAFASLDSAAKVAARPDALTERDVPVVRESAPAPGKFGALAAFADASVPQAPTAESVVVTDAVATPQSGRAAGTAPAVGAPAATEAVVSPASPATPRGAVERPRALTGGPAPESVEVRAVMNAVRSLSRLITAVAFRPGTSASAREKAGALEDLVVKARDYAEHVARHLGDARAQGLPRWVKPALQEVAADALAQQWENGEEARQAPLLDLTRDFVTMASDSLLTCVEGFAEHVYRPATESDIAVARMLVSVNKAAFIVGDALLDAELSHEVAGPRIEQIVRALVAETEESRVAADIPDDLRVSHAQGMVARLAQLTAGELRASHARAEDLLDEAVVRACFERAAKNYRHIEAIAVDAYRGHQPAGEETREKAA
jgi:hypothetical protein